MDNLDNLLTIGEMSQLNNVSTQTLRLYDRIGLLKPHYVDPSNGYRYYNIKQCAMLDMIQYMQALGMSLKLIKKQLNHHDIGLVERVLEDQQQLIDDKIKELSQMRKAIARALDSYQRYAAAPKEGVIVIEYIPERYIYCYDCGINIYDYGLETYEYILRKLKNHILLHRLPMVYFCNVGSILRQADLIADRFLSTEIFLFVDQDFTAEQGLATIPAGTYACIYGNGFHIEKAYATRLLNHVLENGYRIVGDYICEVVAELPVFPQNERNMFIKLQIPIEF